MKTSTWLVVSILLPGCRFGASDSGGDPFATDDLPEVIVALRQLNFGAVAVVDALEHVEIVTISNHGDADLHIQDIALEDPWAPFTISSISSVVVGPGQSTQFEVIYDPASAQLDETYVSSTAPTRGPLCPRSG